MHWVLVVAYMKESKLCFYDSFLAEGNAELKNIFRYLKDAHKRQGKTLNEDNWELVRGLDLGKEMVRHALLFHPGVGATHWA